ncbi:hypothetical protein DYB35_003292 [Aphanomyces astaci]|uniref:PX domain-containing protein n=2 Tax=Aphanomyces astaci TaxID=112090 RepID=A0A397E1U2_APHAT|nr:hypothetical protein DYB30_000550 [Aphanomyces astaci]RHY85532.1 hypothetical protein DYB35_003292 [Aphanomyces astaci]
MHMLHRSRRPSMRYVPPKKGGVEAAMEHLHQVDFCHVHAIASRTPSPSSKLMERGDNNNVLARSSANLRLYTVTMQNAKSGRSWIVRRRYSDFAALRMRLLQVVQPYYFMLHSVVDRLKLLPFPKRTAFITRYVRRHREECFLAYLRGAHVLLTDLDYGLDEDLKLQCASILRGFMGSQDVIDPMHVEYFCRDVIPQYDLHMIDRKCIARCGVLDTVLEEDGPHAVLSDETSSSSSTYGDVESSSSCMSIAVADNAVPPRSMYSKKAACTIKLSSTSKAYAMLFPRKLAACHQGAATV